jgi:hypothetical protein
MLKNKKITYLLIALVALIWGLIFYKVYSKFGGENLVEKSFPHAVVKFENGQRDSVFTLLLDYPDPFLKGPGQQSDIPNTESVKVAIIPPVVNWPSIEYRGLLTDNSKNESTGLLKILNSNLLVKKGKVYSAVKIQTISRDSILLEYQNESRWLRIIKYK